MSALLKLGMAEFEGRLGNTTLPGRTREYALPETGRRGGVRPLPAAHAYANVNQGSFAIGTTSRLIINRTAQRRNFLALRNSSPAAEILFVAFNTAATAGSWLRLTANQVVLFDTVVPQDDVHVVSDSATGQVSYGFGVLPGRAQSIRR